MDALNSDDIEAMRLALAKHHEVDEMPVLTKEDVDGFHDAYMEEMTGTTPFPEGFNPVFTLWEKLARLYRYLGFRNVQQHYIKLRCPDAMPTVDPEMKEMNRMLDILTYAIPTFPALLAMVDTHDKIAEVGAGSGYVASLLAKLGADVLCCDVDVEKYKGKLAHKVEEMDGRDFIRKHDGFSDRALLICWGYWTNGIPKQYEEMIRLFKGDYLYIIGEQRAGMCTFCLAMCDDEVQDQWEMIGLYDLPALTDYMLYDQLVIYKRTSVPAKVDAPKLQMRGPPTRRGLDYL